MLAITSLVLTACSKKKESPQEVFISHDHKVALTAEQLKLSGLVSGKMELKKISGILRVNGRIDVPPQNMVSVSVPLGGYLKYTKLLPGMHVKKGEVESLAPFLVPKIVRVVPISKDLATYTPVMALSPVLPLKTPSPTRFPPAGSFADHVCRAPRRQYRVPSVPDLRAEGVQLLRGALQPVAG